ncbi:MAG TPA: hypothetical protein V6C81_27300 [Planktothrix sp.]
MTKSQKMSRAQVAKMDYPYAWPPESVLSPGPNFLWKREVAIDFDQVVANWTEQYVKFINLTYGYNIDHTQIDCYNMQFDPRIPLTPEQHEEAFIAFSRLSRGGFDALKPYDGIRDTFRAILDAGIRIKIYTWVPGATEKVPGGAKSFNSGQAQRARFEMIKALDLGIDPMKDVKFMGSAAKKWKMAEEHIPLIIEDNPETAVGVGMCAAHAVILVPEATNAGLIAPNVLPLRDRKDLAKTVISFYQKLDAAGLLL